MNVLVTGGAGYIGAHVVRLLRERGDNVVVVDDLTNGVSSRVAGVRLEQIDLADSSATAAVVELLRTERIDGVIHLAARKSAPESVDRPAWYFQQNVGSLANLLIAMDRAAVATLVYSSSAAVYGETGGLPLDEGSPTRPVNPYGRTKLVGEWLVADAAVSSRLRSASLRYFNVAGSGWPDLGDTAVMNLIPMVFERIDSGHAPVIFGDDYPTSDGTCVRDYVHVLDLAYAHLAVLDALRVGEPRFDVFNVGTGVGHSVREMLTTILDVVGTSVEPQISARRQGDPAAVVADVKRIQSSTGWRSRHSMRDIVESAWESHLVLAHH